MKKKYIKPVTVVIAADSGQLLAGSPHDPSKGMNHGNAKEQGMISNVAEGDSSSVIGWAQPNSLWDD